MAWNMVQYLHFRILKFQLNGWSWFYHDLAMKIDEHLNPMGSELWDMSYGMWQA